MIPVTYISDTSHTYYYCITNNVFYYQNIPACLFSNTCSNIHRHKVIVKECHPVLYYYLFLLSFL